MLLFIGFETQGKAELLDQSNRILQFNWIVKHKTTKTLPIFSDLKPVVAPFCAMDKWQSGNRHNADNNDLTGENMNKCIHFLWPGNMIFSSFDSLLRSIKRTGTLTIL
jgi:hypothetical protein